LYGTFYSGEFEQRVWNIRFPKTENPEVYIATGEWTTGWGY